MPFELQSASFLKNSRSISGMAELSFPGARRSASSHAGAGRTRSWARHSIVSRSSLLGPSAEPSNRVSIKPRNARRTSRLAARRCSRRSGRASPKAVTAVQIGHNATEQIGWPAANAAWPLPTALAPLLLAGATARLRLAPRAAAPLFTSAISSSLSRSGCPRRRLTREPHLQPVLHEARVLHLEPLEGLRKNQIPLVRADPNVELLSLSVHVQVGLLDEGQAQRQDVGRPALPDPHGLVPVEDLGPVSARVHLVSQLDQQIEPHHLPVEQPGGEDGDGFEGLPHRRQMLRLDVLPFAEVGVVDLVGDDAV